MRRNTEAERWRATGTLQTENTQVQTANVIDISQSGVSGLWARYQRYEAEVDIPRSECLMSTCRRDDQLIVKEALRNRYFTSTDRQQYICRVRGVAISRQTISNHVSRRWCERTTSASCVIVCSQAS